MTRPDKARPDFAALSAAIVAVEGVAALHGGAHGTVATYRPGARAKGLRVEEAEAQVHLTVYEGVDLAAVADSVRLAVSRELDRPPASVVITIEDLIPRPPARTTPQEST